MRRYKWAVLDWNTPAIGFYERMGRRCCPTGAIVRVTGDALARFGLDMSSDCRVGDRGQLGFALSIAHASKPRRLTVGPMDVTLPARDDVQLSFNTCCTRAMRNLRAPMLGIRLEPELARRLDWLARATGRPKSDLAREAIRRYLDGNVEEARRQSLLASRARREMPSDDTGWTAQR